MSSMVRAPQNPSLSSQRSVTPLPLTAQLLPLVTLSTAYSTEVYSALVGKCRYPAVDPKRIMLGTTLSICGIFSWATFGDAGRPSPKPMANFTAICTLYTVPFTPTWPSHPHPDTARRFMVGEVIVGRSSVVSADQLMQLLAHGKGATFRDWLVRHAEVISTPSLWIGKIWRAAEKKRS